MRTEAEETNGKTFQNALFSRLYSKGHVTFEGANGAETPALTVPADVDLPRSTNVPEALPFTPQPSRLPQERKSKDVR